MNHQYIREIKPPFTRKQLSAIFQAKKTGKKVMVESYDYEGGSDCSVFNYIYAYPSGKIRRISYIIPD